MNRIKTIYVTIYLICLMAFTGCATKLSIKPLGNNESSLNLCLELGNTLEKTLDDAMSGLSTVEGVQTPNVIFDIPSIKKSITDAGYKNVQAQSLTRTKLELSFSGKFDFIEYSQNKTIIKITPTTIKNFSTSLGKEFMSIMDLFMAPALTDEKMTIQEYSNLVAVVYGQPLADEMLKCNMELSIASPKGKIKTYKIALAELLTLTEEKILIAQD